MIVRLLNFLVLRWFGVRLTRVILDRREITIDCYRTRIVERVEWKLMSLRRGGGAA